MNNELAAMAAAAGCPVAHTLAAPNTVSANAAAFNPFKGSYQEDPARSLDWARKDEPVFYSPEIGYWVITRYDDCKQVFREFKNFSAVNTLFPFKEPSAEISDILGSYGFVDMPGLSSMDPPEHREARRANSIPFQLENIEYLEPRVRGIVTEYIDRMIGRGHGDLVADVFWDVPAIVALIFMGIPDEDIDEIRKLALSMTVFTWGRPEDEEAVAAAHGMGRFWEMAGRVLAKLQAQEDPRGWMGHVIQEARVRPELYTSTDLQGLLMGGVLAAHETTTNASLNAIKALLENRDQWDKICANPALIPGAVEECLRYCGSVVAWRRRARVDVEVGGVTIPAGGDVLMVMASANFDPRHFPDPERFDIERTNARDHLTFGFGTHTCLGNNIARMEMRVFLEEFTRRLPSLRLREQNYTYLPNTSFRGPEHLLVEWDSSSPSSSQRTTSQRANLTAIVSQVMALTPDVVEIELRAQEGGVFPAWEPGAHIDLHLEGGINRQYSLTSDPTDLSSYKIAVLREEAGRGGSKYLHEQVRVGDSIEFSGPRNHFPLVAETTEHILLAGGIGITPIVAMAEELHRRGERFTFIYCGRSEQTMPYYSRVMSMPGARVHVSSREGRLDIPALVTKAAPGARIYCCGPIGFIEAAKQAAAGLPADTVIFEKFQSDHEVGPRSDDHALEVECVRMGQTIPVGASETILDALNRAGAAIPRDCGEGICGTCEVRVVDGEIDHRDEVLLQSERDRGDVMLVCCSRAKGDRLVLDI